MQQQFLCVFRIAPNPNTAFGTLPAELMFVRKIKSVFNKLQPDGKVRTPRNSNNISKYSKPGDNVFFKVYQRG